MCFWTCDHFTQCSHQPLCLQDLCSHCTMSGFPPSTKVSACPNFHLTSIRAWDDLCPDCRPPEPHKFYKLTYWNFSPSSPGKNSVRLAPVQTSSGKRRSFSDKTHRIGGDPENRVFGQISPGKQYDEFWKGVRALQVEYKERENEFGNAWGPDWEYGY